MLLGLLSDTHGHTERTRLAAEILLKAGVDAVIHAGDLGSPAVLVELAAVFDSQAIPVHCVLGNVDLYDTEISGFPETTCVRVSATATLNLAGTRIGVIHGHDSTLLKSWIISDAFDLIITGHTHRRADRQHGSTRVINPGAVYRAPVPGCATLDLHSGELSYHDLPTD